MNEKAVYKLNFDCGRMGILEGIFTAKTKDVEKLINSKIEVYFGEALGKHSEIYGPIENVDIELLTDSEEAVLLVEKYKLTNGYNPFECTSINFDFDNLPEGAILKDETIYEIINLMN